MVTTEDEIRDVPLEDIDLFVNQSREAFRRSGASPARGQHQNQWPVATRGCLLDSGRGRLVLICGERRYRAKKLAGIPTMAVKVFTGPLRRARCCR